MRPIVIKSTYPNWIAAVFVGVILWVGIVYLFSLTGCSKAVEPSPVSNDQTMTFWTKSIAPVSTDTVIFTLTDGSGREMVVPVWREGDSLCCPFNSVSWGKWLKCVSHWMDICAACHPNDQSEYWKCVAASAAGCTIGVGWLDWGRFIICPWNW